jgi:hypothetical protein
MAGSGFVSCVDALGWLSIARGCLLHSGSELLN